MEHEEMIEGLLEESVIETRMSNIANGYRAKRKIQREAYQGLADAEANAHLAITFGAPHLLTNPQAAKYLKQAIDEGMKLIADDKKAIVQLELSVKKNALDLAKFDVETDEKDFDKLKTLAIQHQSHRKFTGPTGKLGYEASFSG